MASSFIGCVQRGSGVSAPALDSCRTSASQDPAGRCLHIDALYEHVRAHGLDGAAIVRDGDGRDRPDLLAPAEPALDQLGDGPRRAPAVLATVHLLQELGFLATRYVHRRATNERYRILETCHVIQLVEAELAADPVRSAR